MAEPSTGRVRPQEELLEGLVDTGLIRDFKPVAVFDLSQMDGEDLPEVCARIHYEPVY